MLQVRWCLRYYLEFTAFFSPVLRIYFFLFCKTKWAHRKIGHIWEVLHVRVNLIGIGCAVCPGLLTHLQPKCWISHRNQPFELQRNSNDWFLYYNTVLKWISLLCTSGPLSMLACILQKIQGWSCRKCVQSIK